MFCKRSDIASLSLITCNNVDSSLLPSCRDKLKMHKLRTNYQAYNWNHAHESFPENPETDGNGWKVTSGNCIHFVR